MPEKRRMRSEEEFNRDGRWVRTCSPRPEVWTILEHWTSEHGYRLTAMKGKRRVYQKSGDHRGYATFVEVKEKEEETQVIAWIEAGWVS